MLDRSSFAPCRCLRDLQAQPREGECITLKACTVLLGTGRPLLLVAVSVGLLLRVQANAQAQPNHSAVSDHYHRAEVALARGDNDAAASEFAAILKVEPGNVSAYANLGALAYKRGDLQEAKADLQKALERSPNLWDAKALLGLSEAGLGEEPAALAALAEAFPHVRDRGVKLDAGIALLNLHRQNGTLADAVGIARELEESAASNPEVLYSVYHVYSDLAASTLTKLKTAAPESGRFYQVLAEAALAQDDFPGAITAFRKALSAQPDLPGVHYVLGTTLLTNAQDEKSREEARGEFQAELKRDPREFRSEYELGEVERLGGRGDLAEAHYNRALALHAEYPEAQAALGNLLVERKQYSEALPYFLAAIRLDPDNETYHYRLSRLYLSLNQPDESRREMETFRRLHRP